MTIDFIECGDFRRTICGWLSTSFEPFAVSTRFVVVASASAAVPHKVPRAKSVSLFFHGKSSLKEGKGTLLDLSLAIFMAAERTRNETIEVFKTPSCDL